MYKIIYIYIIILYIVLLVTRKSFRIDNIHICIHIQVNEDERHLCIEEHRPLVDDIFDSRKAGKTIF